ncbi:MAG: DUF6249 domain-containing protein [Bacteroidales bacterium]
MKTFCITTLLSVLAVAGYAQTQEIDSIAAIDISSVAYKEIPVSSFNVESLYGILALTVPFIMIIAIVFISMRYMTQEKIARYKVMEAAIDKGLDLPPSFFQDKNKAVPENKLLYNALKNILIGLVLFTALTVFFELKFGIWLLIITANGLAQLITYLADEKKKKNSVQPAGNIFRKESAPVIKREDEPELTEAEEVNAQEEHIDGEIK